MKPLSASGFTLLELLIALAIVSILAASAGPALQHQISKRKADSSIERVFHAWQYARSLAASNGKRIYICGSSDGTTCSKNWSHSILVFDQLTATNQPAADSILYLQSFKHPLTSHIAFGSRYATINSMGNATLTGSILYCDKVDQTIIERKLTWNLTGRPYITGDHKKQISQSTIHC